MSYGQKPAAWARQPGNTQNQQQLNQNIFANQLGLAAGQAFGAMPTAAMSLGSSLNALVNQAAFSNMNNMSSVLAQAQAAQRLLPQNVPQQNRQAQSPPPSRNQRTFVGTVTKLMETYGFVDEDVFFQTNVIRGAMPRVGDRVMVEASFNPSMPFKWNAYRIQLPQQQDQLPSLVAPQGHHQSYSRGGGGAPSQQQHSSGSSGNRWQSERRDDGPRQNINNNNDRSHRQPSRRSPVPPRSEVRRSPRRSPIRKISPSRKVSPLRSKPSESLKREREKSLVHDSREPTHTRSPAASVTNSGKRDAESPPRRRQRIIPRYRCYKPKQLIYSGDLKYSDLHKRYSSLYIPSDFIRSKMSWVTSIPLELPIKFLPHPVTFSVLHKDVDIPLKEGDSLPLEHPHDADNRYVVKVLLLSHPGVSVLRQKTYGLLADGSIDESTETLTIIKNLQFLVGVKGKNEYMCIGGAWSPSLDGENPLDPQTLINTAVRTTRVLTGVDLSACARWYKMIHLHYYRVERNRVDSVVLMLPDTSSTTSLMPLSGEAFNQLEEKLKAQLAQKLAAIDAEQFAPDSSTNATSTVNCNVVTEGGDSTCQPTNEQSDINGFNGELNKSSSGIVDSSGENTNVAENQTDSSQDAQQPINTTAALTEEGETQDGPSTLTVQSIKNMKVAELREQLEARGLESKGVKNVLLQRLQEALEESGAFTDPSDEKLSENPNSPVKSASSIMIKQEIVEAMETDKENATQEKAVPDHATAKKVSDAEKERLEKEQKALEKAKEKFEKSKKDRKAALERHYVLPKEPAAFVYPNKTAKNGKFDCKVVTLASLLDYRLDDNKENSFEVFLFAEAFRECIDRQNAFIVYNSLDSALEREAERTRRDAALNESKDKGSESSDEVIILESEVEAEKKKNEKEKAEKADKKVDLRINYKAVVHHSDVFAAFAHFDENICGYIEDRDLEEILYCAGVDLSRSETQKLIKKLSSRDRVNYRNLTDKWVDNDGNVKYFSTSALDSRSPADLANGHFSVEYKGAEPALGTTPDITDTGIVFYKGSVLNIIQTMEQHSAVEKERTAAVLKNEEFDMQLKSIKKQRDQLDKAKRRLEEDVDRYKKKLYEAEKCLKAAQDSSSAYKEALMDCKKYAQRISGVVDKAIPPPKKEPKKDKKLADKSTSDTSQKEKSETKDAGVVDHNSGIENGDGIAEDIVLTEEVGGNDDGLDEMDFAEGDAADNAIVENDKATEEAALVDRTDVW